MSSSSDSDDRSDVQSTKILPPKKKQKTSHQQTYRCAWESESIFKGWLTKSGKGIHFCYCKACKCDLVAGHSELVKHAEGKKHIKNCKSISKNQPTLEQFSNLAPLQLAAREAEIKMVCFVAEHNLPVNVMNHLPQLVQSICVDSKIAKEITCGRRKATAILKNVTGKSSLQSLVEKLKQVKFSLLIDESTDASSIKHLCFVVRYSSKEEKTIKDAYFGLLPVVDTTANSLFQCISNAFNELNIPFQKNMIGFAADGASNMMGVNHSVSTLLKNEVPGIFIMKCICHSFALCASYACSKLPRGVEGLAREVYNYFQNSAKRCDVLREFQAFVNVKPHKILHPAQTRWLSLLPVVQRLLEQWDALRLYFTGEALIDRLVSAEEIARKLSLGVYKLYFQFLEFILPLFHDLNKEMQSEHPKLYLLHCAVSKIFSTILECYLIREYVSQTALSQIDPADATNFVPIKDMYLGVNVQFALQPGHSFPDADVLSFYTYCQLFFIEAAQQIQKRFDFNNEILQKMSFLDPKIAMNKSIASIAPLAIMFPNLIASNAIQNLDREWRILPNENLQLSNKLSCEEFWFTVGEITHADGTLAFPNLASFSLSLLSLPHSSAAVERVFSEINNMKTKQRNRLSTKTLNGLLHTRQFIGTANCYSLPIDSSVTNMMKRDIYEFGDSSDE